MDKLEILEQLKELRESKGITQMELAVRLGVSVNTYRNWEYGGVKPNIENFFKLKEILEIE